MAVLALFLPGLAWWAWWGRRQGDMLVALAHVVGVSLASIMLLALGMFMIGGRFSTWSIGLLLVVCLVVMIAGLIKHPIRLSRKQLWRLGLGMIVLGVVILWRLYQARELLLPNWVDAQHHYLIIRVFLEQGGIPETLTPYLSLPFYYHYGFHSLAALFTVLSGLEIGVAMLVSGQILNAMVSLSVYALGKTLWRDWRPAAAAALCVSFVTRMPAYYVSWGRYTLLTGLVLLPLAMSLALKMVGRPRRRADMVVLAALTAGTLLSHYFTGLLLGLFLLILGLTRLAPRLKQLLSAMVDLYPVIVGAGLGLVLAAPWLLRIARFSSLGGGIQSNLPASLSTIFTGADSSGYLWKLLGPASNHWLLAAAIIGLVWGFRRHQHPAFIIWSLTLGFLSLPYTASLKPFRPDHFAIVLFLPVALWAGWLFWQVGVWLAVRLGRRRVATALMALILLGWIVWSFPLSNRMINSRTVLVTADDLAALDWVRENTPSDARFFINTTYWQNNVFRGVDGGGWLLPYTGRWSLVPTVFFGFSPDRAGNQQLVAWGEAASVITTCSPAFRELVEEAELDWVYLREGTGSLQAAGLAGCEGFTPMYANATVSLWQIEP